jgi:hypothetical protein
LDITIKSNSDQLLILPDNRSGPQAAGVQISDSDGVELLPKEEFKGKPYTKASGIGLVIRPSASITESVYLDRWFDLTKPGQYTVKVRKAIPGSKLRIESNQLTISITP